MSHIHLPDGILPLWVWATGWAIAVVWIAAASLFAGRHQSTRRKVPLVAVTAAFILISMSLEIIPIAYHVNLSIIAGALLGPALAPIVAVIVEIVLALMGHGGITVIGVNLILLTLEISLGALLFHTIRRIIGKKRTFWAGFLATLITLAITTSLMVGVVSLAGDHLEEIVHTHAHETSAETAHSDEGSVEEDHDEEDVSFGVFAATVFTLGPIGWFIEGMLTGWVLAYVERVRPSLLSHAWRKRRHAVALPSEDDGS